MALIALTGYGQDQDCLRGRDLGFDHNLVKPVDLDSIKHLVQEITPTSGR